MKLDSSAAVTPSATVADAIAQTLHAYGVRFAFGIPGNDVLESIRACEEQGIEFVLAKAEPSAAFMADAVWQLSGAPAALIPALGPGIANAISGIAGAWMERTAMVVLCGEMSTRNMAIYNHQVFDHVALCRPVTKYAETLNPDRAAQQVAKALDVALQWPAGPVMLNIPSDVNKKATGATNAPQRPERTVETGVAPESVQSLRKMIRSSERPLALMGAVPEGAQRSPQHSFIVEHAVRDDVQGKGIVDEHDPLCLGAVGLSPVDAINLRAVADSICWS
jgi:acetolactate synthase-1/2/3 large subunit